MAQNSCCIKQKNWNSGAVFPSDFLPSRKATFKQKIKIGLGSDVEGRARFLRRRLTSPFFHYECSDIRFQWDFVCSRQSESRHLFCPPRQFPFCVDFPFLTRSKGRRVPVVRYQHRLTGSGTKRPAYPALISIDSCLQLYPHRPCGCSFFFVEKWCC